MENIPRVLPKSLAVQLDANNWTVPSVFGWIASTGGIGEGEMARTFNCGIGGVMVVSEGDVDTVLEAVRNGGETVWHVGRVVDLVQGKIITILFYKVDLKLE